MIIDMSDNSVSLHRVIKASPEKVYRAFTEAIAVSAWLPPYGFLCVVHQLEVHAGGRFKMSFTNFSTGGSHAFGGEYLEVDPDTFLKYTDIFDDPNLPGEMINSVLITSDDRTKPWPDHVRAGVKNLPLPLSSASSSVNTTGSLALKPLFYLLNTSVVGRKGMYFFLLCTKE
jgi:uncharacterized protein YndB with AHSA1/START domain